jgi:hypothetical protein
MLAPKFIHELLGGFIGRGNRGSCGIVDRSVLPFLTVIITF